jgi:hypothetical protein
VLLCCCAAVLLCCCAAVLISDSRTCVLLLNTLAAALKMRSPTHATAHVIRLTCNQAVPDSCCCAAVLHEWQPHLCAVAEHLGCCIEDQVPNPRRRLAWLHKLLAHAEAGCRNWALEAALQEASWCAGGQDRAVDECAGCLQEKGRLQERVDCRKG